MFILENTKKGYKVTGWKADVICVGLLILPWVYGWANILFHAVKYFSGQ